MATANTRRATRRNGTCDTADNNGYVHVFVKPLEGGTCNLVLSLLGVTRLEVPSRHLYIAGCAVGLVGVWYWLARLASVLFSMLSAYYFLALCCRRTLTPGRLYVLFCAAVVSDVLTGINGLIAFTVYLVFCATAALAGLGSSRVTAAVVTVFVAVRVVTLTSMADVPECLRPVLAHVCGFCGVLAAKYTESSLRPPITTIITQDGKILAVRRRRTSSSVGLHIGAQKSNARRTSLPALSSGQKSHQSSSSTVDVALLAEAHGLVTDMLADPSLPPHVVSGLRALASLLSPPNHTSSHGRTRPGGASVAVALADFNSGSDTEEIPYTGERPSALPKRLRRNLPPSLLRRMSTSTWTTTTSATGMPTLEPEPIRKRSTSFRNNADQPSVSPGSGGTSPGGGTILNNRSTSPNNVLHSLSDIPSKGRSYSTTSIPTATLNRKVVRERKTVCSLHPLTSADLEALHAAHDSAQQETNSSVTEELPAEPPDPLPPLPSIRRLNITSDYESSNESPSGSDNNDAVTVGEENRTSSRGPKSLGVQTGVTGDFPRCSLCGARTRQSVKENSSRSSASANEELERSPTPAEPTEQLKTPVGVESDSESYLVDGISYNLEQLAVDPLLSRINEWDYPIFELNEKSSNLILSQMCYRVFLEVGLFDSFRIPLQEFFNYFHALENGYREKPYHNRMHAADVLHGVYYLTSQPIPGFTQMPTDTTDSPLHKTTLVHRQSFVADDNYGIMGANFPALEMMALFTAAAMHDYDHPGRTNAFLVSTYASQAVLYNDRSVLENHHAASAWSLFLSDPRYNWLCHMDKAEFKRFRFLVIECILATDLKQHFEILAEFNAKVHANDDDAHGIDWLQETDRLLVTQMCIKLADINGPCKRHDIHVQWTYRIAEEFYEQGDEEEALGLQISPFMDRRYPQLAKLQESFINHLVAPLCNAYGESGFLPGLWFDGPDSEDDVVTETERPEISDSKDTEDELVDSDQGAPHSVDATVHRRPSRQLRPQKVVCLQTKHLQENYEHWIRILKEENRAKERASGEAQEQEDEEAEEEDEEEQEGSQGEMETIHEEDSSSPKSTPPRDGC